MRWQGFRWIQSCFINLFKSGDYRLHYLLTWDVGVKWSVGDMFLRWRWRRCADSWLVHRNQSASAKANAWIWLVRTMREPYLIRDITISHHFHKKNCQINNICFKSSNRKMPISDFQSQFSMSKISRIFLNFFFIEEYQFRIPPWLNKQWRPKHLIEPVL